MNRFYVFLIRAVLGVALAVVLMRVFFPQAAPAAAIALAVFMIAMAYMAEYLRKRKSGK